MNDEWLTSRLAYLHGLKSPNDQQRLLVLLAEKPDRTPKEDRQLKTLVRAEKAAERLTKARADAARIINAEKASARKARDHALYQSAGLLILAGLVDSHTGEPTRDRGELLGALASLAHANSDTTQRQQWKAQGDALLAGKA